ncbi:replicative helicase loader/inhibitor [Caldifermentibacillus hisashii]|uniref:replicative helicase loader/inhibitor n=1 Tax=Caldifermentibacillus hisashii TaxID=996558 RepID=UPI0031B68E98
MNQQEVLKILNTINAAYSRFEVTDERLVLWSEMLADMDFNKVMNKLKKYIKERPFPPTIADISVQETQENQFLLKYEQWLKEGAERREHEKQSRNISKLPWQ